MEIPARLAAHRSAANYARSERSQGRGRRAAYSVRAANRADRQASSTYLRSLTR